MMTIFICGVCGVLRGLFHTPYEIWHAKIYVEGESNPAITRKPRKVFSGLKIVVGRCG